jgi:Tfp pilus assembly protein PilF
MFSNASLATPSSVFGDSVGSYRHLISGYKKILLGDTAGAVADYNKAIALAPDSASGFLQRAMFHLETNNFRRANADFTTVLVLQPTNINAYYHRGLSRIGLREYEPALEDFSKFIEGSPPMTSAYYYRGICKERLGDDEAAAADYSEAIKIEPFADAYFRRATIKEKYRKYLDAVLDYDDVLKLNPESLVAQRRRGEAKLLAGQRSEGLLDLALAQSMGDSLASNANTQDDDSLQIYQAAEIKVTGTRIELERAVESLKTTVIKGQAVADFSIIQRASLIPLKRGGPVNKSITGENAPIGLSAVSEFDCNPNALKITGSGTISVYCIVYLLAQDAALLNDGAINEMIALMKVRLFDLDLMYLAERKENDINRLIQIQGEKRQIFKDIGGYLKQLQPMIETKKAEIQK